MGSAVEILPILRIDARFGADLHRRRCSRVDSGNPAEALGELLRMNSSWHLNAETFGFDNNFLHFVPEEIGFFSIGKGGALGYNRGRTGMDFE